MKKQPMLKRNDDIELKIDALGSEGQGIGRMDGYAVFVPYALPSERVRAHVIKPSASYAVAKLTEIVEPSQKRCEPGCPAFGKCGGCALMHLEYASQLEYKRQSVYDALKRIGAADVVLPPVMGMDDPYRYRNKASFPVSGEGGAIRFGFYAPKSHRLVPLDDCLIERESLVAVAKTVCIWAEENDVSAYDEATGKGSLRHVMARETSNGEVMAAVVTKGALKARDELIGALTEAVPRLTTIIHNRNDGATNVIFGDRFETVFGPGRITETLAGLSFGISAASFLQVNTEQTEKLYALVDSMTPEGAFRAADVYCGVGTITLMLAKRAAHVTGIEYVPEAIEDARANAGLNNIKNVDFVCGDAARELPKLLTGDALDLIVVDPPRKGCGADVINAICSSGARSLIYVSCDPATLARDVKLLSDAYGIKRAQSVDMFPHTAHVETCVLLSHKNS